MSLAITFRFFVFSCLYAFSVCSTFILCFIIIYKHVHMCFSCYVHVCVCYLIVPVHPFPFLFCSHVYKEFCVCLLSHVYNFALYTHVSVCVRMCLFVYVNVSVVSCLCVFNCERYSFIYVYFVCLCMFVCVYTCK